MPRLRRYRVFLVFAALIIIILVRLRHSRDWTHAQPAFDDPPAPPNLKYAAGTKPPKATVPASVKGHQDAVPNAPPPPPAAAQTPPPSPAVESLNAAAVTTSTNIPIPTRKASPPAADSIPHVVLPDRVPVPPSKVVQDGLGDLEEDLHPIDPPGRQVFPTFSPAAPTTIHWVKQVEHFPVPTESIIKLPTGAPVSIPKIQHRFVDESVSARVIREERLNEVKTEFQKAWGGYKKYAWLHDELSPVSGKFRDPFCGWAATLVDGLDTLWIMGMQEEFEEAAKAVDLIDFTTSPRGSIPMFETTIRYLGGLLAAYDVSGGQYKNLLTKATELAEILMGAFDTPNRMPVLYYRWKPTFASQPHRAGVRSNLAELGSLSLEFTRLAQLTQDPKYYDAIARITNALSEWQDRGTKLGGVFPDEVDASGCNRSAFAVTREPLATEKQPIVSPAKITEEPIGFQPLSPDTVKEPKPKKNKVNEPSGPGSLEFEILPGEPAKAQILGWEKKEKVEDKIGASIPSWQRADSNKHQRRDVPPYPNAKDELASNSTSEAKTEIRSPSNTTVPIKGLRELPPTDPVTGLPLDIPAAQANIGKQVGEWDCTPQGLQPATIYGSDKFSMGGGQDSTYEYFPKQYLLLGGREETYKKMYLKTIEEIRRHMLYRPMVPGDRDILFSGSVLVGSSPENFNLNADVEHLTCFIGGMVGMSAKIFGLEGDLEIAKKLTDGCVWAYESTPSGIMPEGAMVMPCKSSEHCTWNETAYYEFLDPSGATRDQNVADYIANKASREAEAAEAAKAEALKAAEFDLQKGQSEMAAPGRETIPETGSEHSVDTNNTSTHDYDTTDPSKGSESLRNEKPASLQKRQLGSLGIEKSPRNQPNFQGRPQTGDVKDLPAERQLSPSQQLYQDKSKVTEAELLAIEASGRSPTPTVPQQELLTDPLKPLGHKEYVAARIKQESLPPGFVTFKSKKYILRPEAIESVWYMYRITGDPIWQEKGYKMFTSIINATSTEHGHSAIYDVTLETPYQVDEMESFWLAETLKYFYLLFATPDTVSLDEWVLNTEAHPFKRGS